MACMYIPACYIKTCYGRDILLQLYVCTSQIISYRIRWRWRQV